MSDQASLLRQMVMEFRREGQVGPALARRTDPITSHAAAVSVEESGGAEHQRERCLDAVRLYPGSTAAEIASYIGLERHVPSRRLPELRTAGLVENGEARKCEVQGRASITWWPL